MLTLGPDERAALWRRTVTTPSHDRAAMLCILGRLMQEALGSRYPVYRGLDQRFERSLALLDRAGLLGRSELQNAFERLDGDEGPDLESDAPSLVSALAATLEEAGGEAGLSRGESREAVALAGAWRGHLRDGRWFAVPEVASVAEVAAHGGVAESVVLEWCRSGRVSCERRGGQIMIPTDQFDWEPRRLGPSKPPG
ncbi:MAG: hypothetical protein JST31_05130 [Actinobacteria bacterium]|nr:hypothetical protein [Actinomycetota bacterium]